MASEATYDDSRSNIGNFSFRELCEDNNDSNRLINVNIKKAELCENDIFLLQEYLNKEKTMVHERKININSNKSLQNIKKGINYIENNIEKYLDIPFDKEKKTWNKINKLHLTKSVALRNKYDKCHQESEEEKKIKVKEEKTFKEDFIFEGDDDL